MAEARHPPGPAWWDALGTAGKPGSAWTPQEPKSPVAGGEPSPFPVQAPGVQPNTSL